MAQTDMPEYRFILAGEQRAGATYTVACPYDGAPVGTVHRAGPDVLEQAIQAAVSAFEVTRKLPGHKRAAVLRKVSELIAARAEPLARTIALEAGKPIKQARIEVGRSITTFATAAEEATRFHDEVLHLDALAGGENRPAIAAGCPVVLKPASQTPLSALKLAKIIGESGWPAEALSVLSINSRDAAPLVEDDRFKLLTFTGSPLVGWDMKARAGHKRVTLELGGNAGVIIHSDADLAFAAERCVIGG